MAKTTSEQPKKTKGSQGETAVQGNAAEGVSFRELIQSATGSEAPTAAEFESAMAARGYRAGDVRKLTRAFKKVNESGKDYFLRDEGFDVFGGQGQETGSGRAKGNKAGLDLGDLVGLGSDVSLLAGALRNEKNSQDEQRAAQQQQTAQVAPEERLDGSFPQSLSPDAEFARSMGDLLAATATANKESAEGKRGKGPNGEAGSNQAGKQAGKGGEKGQQAGKQGAGWQPGDTFQPNPDVLNFELIPNAQPAQGQEGAAPQEGDIDEWRTRFGQRPEGWTPPQKEDTRTKGERGRELLMGIDPGQTPGFADFSAEDFGLEAYGLGEALTDIGTGGQQIAPWMAMSGKTRGLGKATARAAFPLALTGVAMKGIGDAINPNEDVNWGELGTDAANVAAFALLNKVAFRNTPGAQPSQLPGGSRLRKPTKFSQAQETAQQFKAQIQGRAQNAQNAFSTNPFQRFNISSPGRTAAETQELNFLNNIADDAARVTPQGGRARTAMEVEQTFLDNIADDIARLPVKRRGGRVITKFRA